MGHEVTKTRTHWLIRNWRKVREFPRIVGAVDCGVNFCVIKSYTFGTPAFGQREVVSRVDYRERSLEEPVSLSKNGSVFARVAVSKNSSFNSVSLCRDFLETIFVVNVIESSRTVDCVV